MSDSTSGQRRGSPRRTAPDRSPAAAGPPARCKKVRIPQLQAMKERGERWAMLTAYEQYSAEIFDEAGIPVLLVGDSAGNNVFAYETTIPVTVEQMLMLIGAVSRSVKHSLVVGDMPFGSYQSGPQQALETATRFMKEGGAHAVKLEGGRAVAPQIAALTAAGIPVMAHIGFTPQSEHAIGGYRIQGRGEAAEQLIDDALRAGGGRCVRDRHRDGAGRRGRAGHQGAADPDHRHRRRAALRRPGAGLAGHGRPARRQDGQVRQAVRRPARHAAGGRQDLRRRGLRRHLPLGRAELRLTE